MELPFGTDQDSDFMFTKLIVTDLERSVRFYQSVFGLRELNRVEARIMDHEVEEVVFQPTYQNGPLFILARFKNGEAVKGHEVMLGFASRELDACMSRVKEAGGHIAEPPSSPAPEMPRHAFVTDPEGHVIQLSEKYS